MVELVTIDKADARSFINGREQSLVLEAQTSLPSAPAALARSPVPRALVQADPGLPRAVQDHVLMGGFELFERRVQRKAAMPGQSPGETQERVVSRERRPGRHRPLTQGAAGITQQRRRIRA